MKKAILASAMFILLLSCNNAANDEASTGDSTTLNNTPSAIDTTQHPNGITSGSVISTDTASMNVENMRATNPDSASR